jgi:hypothetical protein
MSGKSKNRQTAEKGGMRTRARTGPVSLGAAALPAAAAPARKRQRSARASSPVAVDPFCGAAAAAGVCATLLPVQQQVQGTLLRQATPAAAFRQARNAHPPL